MTESSLSSPEKIQSEGLVLKRFKSLWNHPCDLDHRSEIPEQYQAIGWVNGKLYSVIFESREDKDGEYCHLVTLWKSTREEQKLYEKNAEI